MKKNWPLFFYFTGFLFCDLFCQTLAAADKLIVIEKPEEQFQKARSLFQTGQYHPAEVLLKELTLKKNLPPKYQVLYAQLLAYTGKYLEALRIYEAILKMTPTLLKVRLLAARLYRTIGKDKQAAVHIDYVMDLYNQGRLKTPAELTYAGMAGWLNEDYHGANEVFQDALEKRPEFIPANLQLGFLYAEKYNCPEAEKCFQAVLKKDKANRQAHLGMASCWIEDGNFVRKALYHLDQILQQNPRHVEALHLKAWLYMDEEQYDLAEKELLKALAVNPRNLQTLTILAVIKYFTDQLPEFRRIKGQIEQVNPAYVDFYYHLSRFSLKKYRYPESILFSEQGLKISPDNPKILADLGLNYTRTGQEQKGVKLLKKAFQKDPFNVRTYNLLHFFEKNLKAYRFVQSKYLKIRLHQKEFAVLKELIPPYVDSVIADMMRSYQFMLKPPLQLDLYANSTEFAVRTIGLPRLGALGVCFGSLITALSPSAGNFNWAVIFRHELSHLFSIQLSKGRVPRWLTEGIAVVEEGNVKKGEWFRRMDEALFKALLQGKIEKIERLNLAFTRARNLKALLRAYYQSGQMVAFIIKRWGFGKIPAALKLYAQNFTTPKVFRQLFQITPAQFNVAFQQFLTQRLKRYFQAFPLNYQAYRDLARFQKLAYQKPKNPEILADLAIAFYAHRQLDKAYQTAQGVLKQESTNKKALYILGNLAFMKKDYRAAADYYHKYLQLGGEGADLRKRLTQIALKENKTAVAIRQLLILQKLTPTDPYPYLSLSSIYDKAKEGKKALLALEQGAKLLYNHFPTYKRLATRYYELKQEKKAIQWAADSLYIYPFDPAIYALLGQACQKSGQPKAAIKYFQLALLLDPKKQRLYSQKLSQIFGRLGDKKSAALWLRKSKEADSPKSEDNRPDSD